MKRSSSGLSCRCLCRSPCAAGRCWLPRCGGRRGGGGCI